VIQRFVRIDSKKKICLLKSFFLHLASEVTLMNIRNARKVFEKLEKEGARS